MNTTPQPDDPTAPPQPEPQPQRQPDPAPAPAVPTPALSAAQLRILTNVAERRELLEDVTLPRGFSYSATVHDLVRRGLLVARAGGVWRLTQYGRALVESEKGGPQA